MSTIPSAESDERTVAVENASYRWGWLLLYVGVLFAACYRIYVRQEAAIDLLVLATGSVAFCTLYQIRQKALTHARYKKMLRIGLVFVVLGAILGLILCWYRG